jgi:signal peptidase I
MVVSVFFVSGCSWTPVRFEGSSMSPNINDGDRVFLNTNVTELKRGEIVAFKFPKDQSKTFIKRIVGLPNETLEVRQGKVFINGIVLEENYIDSTLNQAKLNMPPKKILAGHYFVMGDYRDNSYDSRSWGQLPRELIWGKYSITYFKEK